jgi:hypothetical protein
MQHWWHMSTEIHVYHHLDWRALESLFQRLETHMTAVDDELAAIQATQAQTDATITKVAADVTTLLGLISAVPTTGLTPAQQTALDAVAAHATLINTNLGAVDTAAQPPAAPAVPAAAAAVKKPGL